MKKFSDTIIMAFINQKGGIGKSTLTQHAALTLAEFFGLLVAVIDTDFQKSLAVERASDLEKIDTLRGMMKESGFNPARIENKELKYLASVYNKIRFSDLVNIIPCELAELENEIDRLDGKYDMIIIDTPGYQDEEIISVFAYLDVAIIPVVMNKKDINSSMDFIQNTVSRVKTLKENEDEKFVFAGLLNKYSQKDENKQIFEFGKVMEMKIFDVGLSDRAAQYDRMTNTLTSVANSVKEPETHEVYKISAEILGLVEAEFN